MAFDRDPAGVAAQLAPSDSSDIAVLPFQAAVDTADLGIDLVVDILADCNSDDFASLETDLAAAVVVVDVEACQVGTRIAEAGTGIQADSFAQALEASRASAVDSCFVVASAALASLASVIELSSDVQASAFPALVVSRKLVESSAFRAVVKASAARASAAFPDIAVVLKPAELDREVEMVAYLGTVVDVAVVDDQSEAFVRVIVREVAQVVSFELVAVVVVVVEH